MSITKIDDAQLSAQNRFHANQSDTPEKTATEMKEFMDYIPRNVIIPKVNEVIDAVNGGADNVYTKAQTDALLEQKSDKSNTYTKSETDTALSSKADSNSVYTKTQADKKFCPALKGELTGTGVSGCDFTDDGDDISIKLKCAEYTQHLLSEIKNGDGYLKCHFQTVSELTEYLDTIFTEDFGDTLKLFETDVETKADMTLDIKKEASGYILIENASTTWGTSRISLSNFVAGNADLGLFHLFYGDSVRMTAKGGYLILGVNSDVANKTVKVCGSNMADIPDILCYGNEFNMMNYISWYQALPVGTVVTVSCDLTGDESEEHTWKISIDDDDIILFSANADVPCRKSYTHTKEKDFSLSDADECVWGFGEYSYIHHSVKNITVNSGQLDLGYEPYRAEDDIETDQNGQATLPCEHKTYSFVTENSGLIIECNYKKDINEQLSLFARLLGGKQV